MSVLLKLLETPAIVNGSMEDEIHPLKAFQCFVLLNLADAQRLDRAKLAELLWPGVEKRGQADRLRPTLSRLKSELERLGLAELLNSNRSQVWLSRRIPTDLDLILETKVASLRAAAELIRPLLSGWEPEIARPIRNLVELRLEHILLASAANLNPSRAALLEPVLGRFLDLYPTNSNATGLAYRIQKEFGSEARANELVISFEDAWLEEYGQVDLPSILDIAARFSKSNPVQKPRKLKWPLVALAAAASLVWFVGSRGVQSAPGVWLRKKVVIEGRSFELYEAVPPKGSKLCDFRVATDGGFIGVLQDEQRQFHNVDWLGRDRVKETLASQHSAWREDRLYNKDLVQDTDGLSYVMNDEQRSNLSGTTSQPRILLDGLLRDGSAVYECASTDGSISRRTGYVSTPGGSPVKIASFSEAMPVAYPSFASGVWLFGVATQGTPTHWKQIAFRASGKETQILGEGYPEGILSNGDIFVVRGRSNLNDLPFLLHGGTFVPLPTERPPNKRQYYVVGGVLLAYESRPDRTKVLFSWDGSRWHQEAPTLPERARISGPTWNRDALMIDLGDPENPQRFILKASEDTGIH